MSHVFHTNLEEVNGIMGSKANALGAEGVLGARLEVWQRDQRLSH